MSTHEAEGWQPITMSLGAGQSMEMIWCPPGTARVGAPLGVTDPKQSMLPSLPIRLSRGFYMARVPVTQAIWRIMMEREPPVGRNNILDAEWAVSIRVPETYEAPSRTRTIESLRIRSDYRADPSMCGLDDSDGAMQTQRSDVAYLVQVSLH